MGCYKRINYFRLRGYNKFEEQIIYPAGKLSLTTTVMKLFGYS